MPKQEVISPDLAVPNGHFAQATVAPAQGRLLFVSGMTARNAAGDVTGIGDITAQTHQVCQNLAAAVKAAGGTLDDIARVDVYVRNMEDFAAIHGRGRQVREQGLPHRDQRHRRAARRGAVVKLATVLIDGKEHLAAVYDHGVAVLPSSSPTLGEVVPLSSVRLVAPLRRFRRDILCTGWNYSDHFDESSGKREGQDPTERPRHPTFFTKGPDTVIGPYDPIAFDAAISAKWDYEAESPS